MVRRLLRWWASARVEVRDASMEPLLRPGDRLRIDRCAVRTRAVRPGEVVVVIDPEEPRRWLVKRIGTVLPAEPAGTSPRMVLVSDRPDGARDSRTFGPVGTDRLIGRPYHRYAPFDRRGPL